MDHDRRGSGARWRSVLFAPATRPEMIAKLPRSGPDAVVVDLEDAVPASDKDRARDLARAAVGALAAAGPAVLVRVNAVGTDLLVPDVAAVAGLPGLDGVVVPKLETVAEVTAVRAALDDAGGAGVALVAGVETALGVADARAVLAAGVDGAYFGAEDLVADMGGQRTPGNAEVAVARAGVALAARLAGVALLDMVVVDLADHDRFVREAAEARALGYAGKLCIHPSQVPLANAAFVPSADEVDRARRLLAAYDAAAADGVAAIAFEGQMVDEPLARRARDLLAAADRAGETPQSGRA
jgi:citrate lyase subunit beta/citryl-CoA lyase